MSKIEKEKTRVLIQICTRSLYQMIAGAALARSDHVEDGRESLEKALLELAGVSE